ncbi:MAG TPA: hypothetical protein PLJ88_12860, partial [Agitococcus sp.]|nr:hypothetical protein [Agitococcus sp.]
SIQTQLAIEPVVQQEAKAEPTVAVNTESQLDTVQGTQAATESGNNTESPVLSDREIHVKLMARSNELVNLASTNKQPVTESEYADEWLAIQALTNPIIDDEVILDHVDLIIKLVTSLNNPSITRFALDSLKKAYARVAKDQQEKTAKGQHTSFRKADDPKRAAHQAKLDEMRIAAEEAMKKGLQGINQLENLGTKPKKEETPTPNKPVSPSNTTQTPKTTGEQIAEAFDKTAKAITEASHAKVVERVKNGEEIVYKQPAAIDSNKKSVFEALTRYGWSLDAVLGGVSKTFAGLAEAGAISDGSRTLNADFDSRERYLAVTDNDAPTGGAIIPETEIDLRDYGYNAEAFAKAAKAFNE